MRNIYPSQLFHFSTALTLFFFLFNSCTAVQMKKVTVQKADDYKYTAQKAGLKISVDLYKEENRLQDYFGCDTLSRGVLPVFVVIENFNAEDGYILLKEKSGLVMANSITTITEDNFSEERKKAIESEKAIFVTSGVGIIIAPIVTVVAIPLLLVSEKKSIDEFAISRNITENQLVDKVLYKGATHSGFLYFQINDKEDISRIAGVSLSLQNIRSKQVISFIINLD